MAASHPSATMLPCNEPRVTFRAMQPKLRVFFLICTVILTVLTGCTDNEEPLVTVTIVHDNASEVVVIANETTVADVLRRAQISLGDLDNVNPPPHSRIQDGMTITVQRVRQDTDTVEEIIPFEQRIVPTDSLPAGQREVLQPGVNGVAHVTYRFVYIDGVLREQTEIRSFIQTPPVMELVLEGRQSQLSPVIVSGTLAYISGGNAWIMRENSTNRRALTQDGGVDGLVFELSSDGKRLLFTRNLVTAAAESGSLATTTPPENRVPGEPFNSLWVILDISDPNSEPIRLDLENIRYAAWVPATQRTIVYSTAEPTTGSPGWRASNDLWRATISATGAIVRPRPLLEACANCGIYGWYGTVFEISPDGSTFAWAQADVIGILVPDVLSEPDGEERTPTPTPTPTALEEPTSLAAAYTRQSLTTFVPRPAIDFVWIPQVAWSPDGQIVVAATHGAPLGSQLPEESPVFNLTAFLINGGYSADIVEQAGMWATIQFSPASTTDTPQGIQIAYLQAINPLESFLSKYQLVIMDRDGSNRRTIFPPQDQPGLEVKELRPFVWSPSGRQIAVIYQGNIYLVDVVTGISQQVTGDGLASSPRWTP